MRRLLLSLFLLVGLLGATEYRTEISATIVGADGTLASGTVHISWSTFVSTNLQFVAAGRLDVYVKAGVFDVKLYPNDTAVPAGTSYQVTYDFKNGVNKGTEYWVVPTSATAVALSSVRTASPPVPAVLIAPSQIVGGIILGDLLYGNGANSLTRLPGNTTSTRKFLRQTGTGSVSAAMVWDTLLGGDLPSPAASTLGGVKSLTCTGTSKLSAIGTDGLPVCSTVRQVEPGASDPGCTTTADIGKIWPDTTTTSTVLKFCLSVTGSLTWVTK